MNQYNFDNSDSMSDYWHKNFFAFFNLHYPLLKRARVELGLKVEDTSGHGDELNQEDIDHQTKYGIGGE